MDAERGDENTRNEQHEERCAPRGTSSEGVHDGRQETGGNDE